MPNCHYLENSLDLQEAAQIQTHTQTHFQCSRPRKAQPHWDNDTVLSTGHCKMLSSLVPQRSQTFPEFPGLSSTPHSFKKVLSIGKKMKVCLSL